MAPRFPPQLVVLPAVLALALSIGGCTTDPARQQRDAGPESHHDASGGSSGLPSQHVHGVARNPADGQVYLATHDGLFRITPATAPVRVGPVIDLMGFTLAGPNHFYASGHPGPGTDLPNPVGLIESTDAGQTWTPLSRQGQSDFHTLTASGVGIVGFDGEQLATTRDGRTWQRLTPPVVSHAVAASPDGTILLATSESGLARSADAGKSWQLVTTPMPLQLVAWADATTTVGVAPGGQIATSTDTAATWTVQGSVGGAPHALAAHRTKEGGLEVLAVTGQGLVRSTDNKTFTPYGR